MVKIAIGKVEMLALPHPNSKQDRKVIRPFSPAFFSKGTVVEFDPYNDQFGIRLKLTVDTVERFVAADYILHGKSTDQEHGTPLAIRISQVTSIVQRAPGVMKLNRPEVAQHKQNREKFNEAVDFGDVAKHSSQYQTISKETLVQAIIYEYRKDDQIVDKDKMMSLLEKEHLFKSYQSGGFWSYPVYIVNKKKLRNAIKRLFSKCLVKHMHSQRAYDNAVERRWNWNADIQDFTQDNNLIQKEEELKIEIEKPA
jgi:hypothetical protein